MCEQFPEPPGRNEAADEGTASHWIASETLEGRPAPTAGAIAPNGITIDLEMIEGAYVYVDAVRHAAGGVQLQVESRLTIGYIHPECFGTTDCWFVKGNELHVWDYKYGFSIVDPLENWQMICYTAGIIQQLVLSGMDDQQLDVVMHIVQPRPFHLLGPHRTWRVKAADLRNRFGQLADAANKALAPNPQTASGKHCIYCSARHACPTLQKSCMAGIDYVGVALPEMLSAEALAIELRVIQRIKNLLTYRETGLTAQAEALIKSGGLVPGWTLQPGQGRANWTCTAAEIFALGDLMGMDLRAEPSAITPAQAKKKGLSAELLATYSKAGDTAMKLVQTTDSLASRVFTS